MSVEKPHDKFFKSTFSIKEVAEDYIQQFLPKEISSNLDLKTLEHSDGSYVDDVLSEHFSDIVYYCESKGNEAIRISLLFEHKSYVPQYPHLQLLRYLVNAWENDLKDKKSLTVTIPIILYHGQRKWHYKPFNEYFKLPNNELTKYIPNFDYHLSDLRDYSDEALLQLKAGFLINTLLIFKYIWNVEYLQANSAKIFVYSEDYIESERGKNFLKALFVYIGNATKLKPKTVSELYKNLPKKISDLAMTTFEAIKEEGKKEGKKEGILLEKRNTIVKLKEEFPNWSTAKIAEFTNSTEKFVARVLKEHNQNK
ncbi:MAG: Rpn family recombination-promoting nuclease/putative transposase [Chitinophagales bacterium]